MDYVVKSGMTNAVTSIQINVMTRDRLRQFAMNGETYDEVLLRLMETARKASPELVKK